ncbi:Clp protease-domain-containing protein [Microdochium trichocladiopsis]|uniref:ATP-dependent Clp protease proteolytic subunit n=1 Tax=Microdochium trichocladiopsis TaxID=1682393 RepID=A0A9P9BRJ3_9PEZI|nr:Clp protease-domain-containing protein [Microdochium trichocladiopsis]KAH7032875.1 Clp protease-domain-containing protein [Microdochium trichocladiopsis]
MSCTALRPAPWAQARRRLLLTTASRQTPTPTPSPFSRRIAAATVGALQTQPARYFSQHFPGFSPPGLPGQPQQAPTASPPRGAVPLPYITEVTSGGWRTYDIFSKLLQERIVCLNGAIDDTVSASIVAQLLWLESDNPEKPITMYIHSPGGSITAGLAIYDTMAYIRSPVSTVCLGQAASMASLLLTGGEKGKRYALPHSSIMIHQPLGGTQGQASDILIYANQIQRTREQVNEIYRKHLNESAGRERFGAKEVEDMMDRDRYLTAPEAKEMGIVDEILTRRPERKPDDDKAAEGSTGSDAAKTS